eukprot:5186115-Heterocapsa_arctica.AAC.1
MAVFIQEVLEPQLDDAGKAEARSFRDLLESKTQALYYSAANEAAAQVAVEAAVETAADAVAAVGNSAPGADHTDPMIYIIVEDAVWKGSEDIYAKEKHLNWYVDALTRYLRSVNPDTNGYTANGWVTVQSVLLAPNVYGVDPKKSWAVSEDNPFDGHAL